MSVTLDDEVPQLHLRVSADPLASLSLTLVQLLRFPSVLSNPVRTGLLALMRSERGQLAPLQVLGMDEPPGGLPMFLGELAGRGTVTFEEQLDQLQAWTATDIRSEVERCCAGARPAPELQAWLDSPVSQRDGYVRALRRFNDHVFSVLVPGHERRQRREAERWAIAAAMSPAKVLISALNHANPNVRLERGRLRVTAVSPTARVDRTLPSMLTLYPCFGGPQTLRYSEDDELPADSDYLGLATSALRLDRLSESVPTPAPAMLVSLLGSVPAAILDAVARGPVTTTQLAGSLARSPSTVSYHLSGLRRQHLVVGRRHRNEVRYELTEFGAGLHEMTTELQPPHRWAHTR